MASTRIYCCGRTLLKLRHFYPSHKRFCSQNLLQRKFNYCVYNRTYNSNLYRRLLSTSAGEGEDGERLVYLSDKCIKQLKKITADENDKDTFLRVLVEGGGCSGFQYVFKLDNRQEEDDRVFEREGVKVVTDEASLEIINGSTIDYQEELIRSAFAVIDNPKAEMGCSCGVSFSLKI